MGSLQVTLGREGNARFALSALAVVLIAAPAAMIRAAPAAPIAPPSQIIPVTLRDFNAGPPDFEILPCAQSLIKGVVLPYLGPDRKPLRNPLGPCPEFRVEEWFRDDSAAGRYCRSLKLERIPGSEAAYVFNDAHFFPLDDVGTQRYKADDGRLHNFHFSLETHLTFKYRGGEIFSYLGDDEIFVFVNGRLAVDLGGNHGPLPDVLDMDAMSAQLGLVKGNYYDFDLFFCERHTSTSYLKLTTTIDFLPAPPGGIRIADAGRSLLSDTVTVYRREPPVRFLSARARNRTTEVGCYQALSQERAADSGDWSFAGQPAGRDSALTVDAEAHALGLYRLAVRADGTGDSIWVRVALPRVESPRPSPRGGVNCDAWKVKLTCPTPGARVFYTTGDEPYGAGAWKEYTGEIIALTGDKATLRAVAVKPGFSDSPLLKETYLRDQTFTPVSKPPGDPASVFPVKVALSTLSGHVTLKFRVLPQDDPPGAVIADSAWHTYASPIDLANPALIEAKAIRAGCRESDVMTEDYGMPTLLPPAIDPTGKEFWPKLSGIHITAADPRAAIYYSIDSLPQEEAHPAWPPYAGESLKLGRSAVIRAVAALPGYRNSAAAEEYYVRGGLHAGGRYLDRDGDGRIESAVLTFDHALPYAPAVRLIDPISGRGAQPQAAFLETLPAGPEGVGKMLSLRFPPFAFGTGFAPGPFAQVVADSLFPDLAVAMEDSAGPVLLRAECRPPKAEGDAAALQVEFSEPVGAASGAFPYLVERGGNRPLSGLFPLAAGSAGAASGSAGTASADSGAFRTYSFAGNVPYPCRGDSLKLMPAGFQDLRGNPGAMAYWIPISGQRPKEQAEIGELRLQENPVSLARFQPSPLAPAAALVDPQGLPLTETPGNRLVTQAPGPVFLLPIRFKPDRISLQCFDNLGVFVARAEIRVSASEWEAIRAYSNGDGGLLRLKWYPVSHGQLLATGAYVIQGRAVAAQGVESGADGQEIDQQGAARILKPFRFGILRR